MRFMIIAALAVAGGLAAGCKDEGKSVCQKYCEASISEYQDYLDEYDCELDHADDYLDECVEECKDAMDDIGSSDREEAEACIECVYKEVGSSPDNGDTNDAIEDECEDECLDEEGMWEFLQEFDGVDIDEDDIDCDDDGGGGGGDGYDNVAACQDLEDTINGLSCMQGQEPFDMYCESYEGYAEDYTDYLECLEDCYYCDGDYLSIDSDLLETCNDLVS